MTRHPASAYRPLERTVDIHSVLAEAQYLELHRLLGQPPGRFKAWPNGYLFDLTHAPGDDRVLAYLREQKLPHTVAEERHWRADPPR
jgi:hypothetical protein